MVMDDNEFAIGKKKSLIDKSKIKPVKMEIIEKPSTPGKRPKVQTLKQSSGSGRKKNPPVKKNKKIVKKVSYPTAEQMDKQTHNEMLFLLNRLKIKYPKQLFRTLVAQEALRQGYY